MRQNNFSWRQEKQHRTDGVSSQGSFQLLISPWGAKIDTLVNSFLKAGVNKNLKKCSANFSHTIFVDLFVNMVFYRAERLVIWAFLHAEKNPLSLKIAHFF